MAFKIESRESFRRDDSPIAIKTQFSRDKLFTQSFTTDEQSISNLKNLLLTRKGERYNLPTFGSSLLNLIFEPNTDQLTEAIRNTIKESVSIWLPYIQITNIDVVTGQGNSNLIHQVNVTISFLVKPTGSELSIAIFANENGEFEVVEE
jgi:phage baseplate assembly protein W